MKTIPNLYILEGGEGVFKTTIAKKLVEEIPNAVYLRDPGGNILCEKIRDFILENEMIPYTEMFLFLASRATLFEEEIVPALNAGKIVILDRFYLSNIVYQGIVRGCGADKVLLCNRWIMGEQKEAATFLLDMDVEKALARCKKRIGNNRLDEYGISFHNRIRQGYLDASKGIDSIITVDASDFNEAYHSIYTYIMTTNKSVIHNGQLSKSDESLCDCAFVKEFIVPSIYEVWQEELNSGSDILDEIASITSST